MQHKLILGGAQYLPFARSRIKALRATGQKYATQRYLLPDGEVRVEIAGDQEYIFITGKDNCIYHMDSGVVDLHALGTTSAGTLYESIGVATYNIPFVFPAKGDTTWRLNPEPTSAGQLSGSVYKALTFAGKVPGNAADARSFSPLQQAVTPATDPPTYKPLVNDPALADKKALVLACPASVFTGRCRLFVQAVYGRHSYEYVGHAAQTTRPLPTLQNATSAAPALWFASHKTDPAQSFQPVLVDTSCGVWLDPASGRHWLLKPMNGGLTAYPLYSNTCGEILRKYLVTVNPAPELKPLNAVDREHLEAYILSTCLPYVGGKVTATGGAIIGSGYSMGYGWHWNWSGTMADMVVNNTFQQADLTSAMRSTHYRIVATHALLDGVHTWTVAQSTVEAAQDWAVYRGDWTIAEPDFAELGLTKTTPRSSTMFECNAPFYAFYLRDTLKTCRVRVRANAGNLAETIYVNCYGGNCVTMGLNEGSRTVTAAGSAYFSATFTVGDVVTPELPIGKTVGYDSVIEVKNKRLGDWRSGYGTGSYGQRTFEISDDYGGGRYYYTETSSLVDDRQTRLMTLDTSVSSKREEFPSQATVVVPLYDAEAVYLQATTRQSTYVTANTTHHLRHSLLGVSGAFLVRMVTDENYTLFSYAKENGAFASDDLELDSTESLIPENVHVVTSDTAVLVCRAGAVPATFSHLNELHNNAQDDVADGYFTLSGTSVSTPVVIALGYITPVGIAPAPARRVLVGWI